MLSVFLFVPKLSLSASVVAMIVMLARLCLRKAPKIFSYVLWLAVLLRLLCPFSMTIPIKALPELPFSSYVNSLFTEESTLHQHDAAYSPSPETAIPSDNTPYNPSQPEYITVGTYHENNVPVQPEIIVPTENNMRIPAVLAYIWLAGTMLMLCYFAWSYASMSKKMNNAVRISGNVFESDRIGSAFVLGLLKPKIYIPTKLNDEQRHYIILHEQTHIRRCDYLVKYIAFVALALHWFNPVVWLSYSLMCGDMEKSCDEAVIRKLSESGQPVRRIIKQYSMTLLSLTERNGLAAPVSFADNSISEKMKNIMKYRKRSTISMICLAVVCALLTTACMSSPVDTSAVKEADSTTASASDANAVTSSENISDSQFPDLLAEYSTSFNAADIARSSNLAMAGEYIDGTVLEPGDVFSFNKVVGERTPERGFCKATVSSYENTDDDYGGGIIQTSSTLFYCAMKANLELVHRTNNLYTVSYMIGSDGNISYGLDAAVVWGKTDMQFRNSKENPIKIRCHTENGTITFSIWGTWDGFTAEYQCTETETVRYSTIYRKLKEGKEDQEGQLGRTIWTYRVVYYQADPSEGQPEEYERYREYVSMYRQLSHIKYVKEPPAGYQFETLYDIEYDDSQES